jgi:hypothetical protein
MDTKEGKEKGKIDLHIDRVGIWNDQRPITSNVGTE